MPPVQKHLQISAQRTGNQYKEVHEWIDNPDLKDERHDITRVLEFAKMFTDKYGEEAAQEYVQHLADDLRVKFGHLAEDVQAMIDKNLVYFGTKKPSAD